MSTDLPPIEIEVQGTPTASVIWLHGLGADGHDFEMLLPELHWPAEIPARFIFPHAPIQPVTINGGMRMRAWYDIYSLDTDMREDDAGIRAAAAALGEMIEREIQRGIPAHRILLAGFSQGGAVVLHTGLRYHAPLAGILALSTYLPLADTLANEHTPQALQTPVLMLHGTEDTVVVPELADRSHEFLQSAGVTLVRKNYAMGHSLCPEEVRDIRQWMLECLSKTVQERP